MFRTEISSLHRKATKRRTVCDVSDRRVAMQNEMKSNPNKVNSYAKLQQALTTPRPGQIGAWPVAAG
jgi:hypothetical protein